MKPYSLFNELLFYHFHVPLVNECILQSSLTLPIAYLCLN